ncbi:hypothetical protein K504DRAFT_468248 [Pleomassaria siparia CBS 279.74]|uniref:Uncharacterized protein n=1 Tax=Pleomassaria siparia CBS 279.74 TaxID=1314801 RepID=A0A6G1K8C9_9PLEO|nr:hypothetical protein K504DRAFT_468248 [Pleomassaria siparia CBS 279.74]
MASRDDSDAMIRILSPVPLRRNTAPHFRHRGCHIKRIQARRLIRDLNNPVVVVIIGIMMKVIFIEYIIVMMLCVYVCSSGAYTVYLMRR